MEKAKRNDPCPCGSGKKFKKCCWGNENIEIVEQRKWEEERNIESLWKEEYEADDEIEYDMSKIDEVFKNIIALPSDTPEVSTEEEILVDRWWDEYKEMNDSIQERRHLETFIEEYPELVINLEVHHEILFELGAGYLKLGMQDDHINFLMSFRKRFPDSYEKSGGYYDSDIIAWLIVKNRTDEIPEYLSYLLKYPDDFSEQLETIVNVLVASGKIKYLANFIEDESYFRGFVADSVSSPYSAGIFIKHLQKDYSDENVHALIEELKNSPVELSKRIYEFDYWEGVFESTYRPYREWPGIASMKRTEVEKMYYQIVHNYTRFVHDRTGMPWETADYYGNKLIDYIFSCLEGEKPKRLVDLSKARIEKLIFDQSQTFMFFLDDTKALGMINSLYHFADYLKECDNIEEKEKNRVQDDLLDIYKKMIPTLKKSSIEAHVFNRFPYFKAG
ncbi:MAG: hypothetical protein ACJA2S_001253 [Cyclobacteriaceae bacterium]